MKRKSNHAGNIDIQMLSNEVFNNTSPVTGWMQRKKNRICLS